MPPKRKAEEEASGSGAGPSTSSKKPALDADVLVNPQRMRVLKDGAVGAGPVIYWMSRDQRMKDNWALLHALEQAAKQSAPVAVAFNLVPAYLNAGARHFCFMLKGLRELETRLKAHGIPFFLLKGDPVETVPQLVADTKAALLVTDYASLRLGRQWRTQVAERLPVPFHEVDAHNVVPVWVASPKREYGARTIRPKIHKHLPEFLREFPETPRPAEWGPQLLQPEVIDWEALLTEVRERGPEVPEVTWCVPGEDAAAEALSGPNGFLSAARLGLYETKRNDPAVANALSNLSPYLHYGQIAPQRAALEAAKHRSKAKGSVEGFLEELVVRRELADNYCHYCPDNYDSLDACYDWAKETLAAHANDPREVIYTREQLEAGATHDELWNAAQLEMVHRGKMHGFMRMYWAKKILEWTPSPETALADAIYLNDRWELDGRDPNGYVGCMWSIGGIHDQGWAERPIFGKIRYMNYAGCKRKFDIKKYVEYVNNIVREVQAARGVPSAAMALPSVQAATAAAAPKRKVTKGKTPR